MKQCVQRRSILLYTSSPVCVTSDELDRVSQPVFYSFLFMLPVLLVLFGLKFDVL